MAPVPRSFQVSQSCGRHTAAVRAAFSGSFSASQRSLVTVNDATGTSPTASAHAFPPASGPPSSVTRSAAAPAERVSFHSSAGRTTSPSSSRQTMPCCCPPTATAATSSRPPASVSTACSATRQAAGCTSVPSGCADRPSRTSRPDSASRTTTLHDWVDESTPATSVIDGPPGPRSGSAGAEQVLEGELVELGHRRTALRDCIGVEVLERRPVGQQLLVAALAQGGRVQLVDLGSRQSLLHLGVGAERGSALLEQQVGAHVRRGRGPDAVHVLGAQGLVVEVAGAVVGRAAVQAAVLQQVDG